MQDSTKLKLIFVRTLDYIKKAKVEFLVIISVLTFDLISKFIVANTVELDNPVKVINNILYIWYTHNYNAAFSWDFGLGELFGAKGVTIVFVIITFLAILIYFVLLYRFRHRNKFLLIMIGLIIAGALGNLCDRLILGYVRDFLYIEYGGADLPLLGTGFAIFNVADFALVVGMIGIIIYVIFMYTKDSSRIKTLGDLSTNIKVDAGENIINTDCSDVNENNINEDKFLT